MPFRPPYRHAGDRVYQAIKARLIAYEFPQGRRILLEPIAESLGVSTTPVREAMNRLAERDLVIKAENKGFYAMTLTETRIKGYYEVTRDLLVLGLEHLPPSGEHKMRNNVTATEIVNRLNRRLVTDAGTLARYTGKAFHSIAMAIGNEATLHAVEMANDHLYFVRTLEYNHIADTQAELAWLCELLLSAGRPELTAAIGSYYDRRLTMLRTILKDLRHDCRR